MKRKNFTISIIIALMLSFALSGCGTKIENESRSLYAGSIEELVEKIQAEKKNVAPHKKGAESRYEIGELNELLYPEIQSEEYVLIFAEINPYRILYYYQPVSEVSGEIHTPFDYKTGIVVGVSREKNEEGGAGAIQVIAKQIGADISPDGTVYDARTKTLSISTEEAYYYVRMPGNCDCVETDIRALFVMKTQNLS